MNPIKPMLAVSGEAFAAPGWIFEPKIDGTRCIAHISRDEVHLQNRRLADISYRYPELVSAFYKETKGTSFILDGEIAIFFDGLPDFASLAEREHQTDRLRIAYLSSANPASYVVFDILHVDGVGLMDKPLLQRKAILKEKMQDLDFVSIIDFFSEDGEAYYSAAAEIGLEGIVGKRASSIYQPGIRSPDWIKIKKRLAADLVVGGYIPGRGKREGHFGGLLIGAYDSDNLIYLGRVGTGFSEQELKAITRALKPASKSPFFNPPATPGVIWVKPEVVVEVSALEVTARGHLRAPVFIRCRDDKDPKDSIVEQIGGGKSVVGTG